MEDENKATINLREILQACKATLDNLNENTLIAVVREQNRNFDKALQTIEKYLPAAEKVMDHDKADLSIKTATLFLINLWSKVRQGESLSELNTDDWNEILRRSAETAVMINPQEYSMMVFDMYRRSIALAIEPMRGTASESVIERLEEIVSLMKGYDESLKTGDITEISFIEENLWLSLEAVFLVMSDRMSHKLLPEERKELAEAISALVFQRFRYKHYDKELAVIDECLKYQDRLDQKLAERVNDYIDSLKEELDEFDALVEKAFNAADFQAAFRGSVSLAESLGAEGILRTQTDLDDYFIV